MMKIISVKNFYPIFRGKDSSLSLRSRLKTHSIRMTFEKII